MGLKPSGVADRLSKFESEILRISYKIESFGSLLEKQATSADGCEDFMGLGFALVDLGLTLREVSDGIGSLVGSVD